MLPIAYVAGPYRADTPAMIEENVRQAAQEGAKLAGKGWAVFCPHTNWHQMSLSLGAPPPLASFWLDCGLAMLARCDILVLLPTWGHSDGATVEMQYGVLHQMPVYVGADRVPNAELYMSRIREYPGIIQPHLRGIWKKCITLESKKRRPR